MHVVAGNWERGFERITQSMVRRWRRDASGLAGAFHSSAAAEDDAADAASSACWAALGVARLSSHSLLVHSAHWHALLVNSDQFINVEALHSSQKARLGSVCRGRAHAHAGTDSRAPAPDALTVKSHLSAGAGARSARPHSVGASTLSADEGRGQGALDDYG
jgi:hypothetical protein